MDDVAQTEMVLKRIGEELGAIQVDNATGTRVEVMDKKTVPNQRKTPPRSRGPCRASASVWRSG